MWLHSLRAYMRIWYAQMYVFTFRKFEALIVSWLKTTLPSLPKLLHSRSLALCFAKCINYQNTRACVYDQFGDDYENNDTQTHTGALRAGISELNIRTNVHESASFRKNGPFDGRFVLWRCGCINRITHRIHFWCVWAGERKHRFYKRNQLTLMVSKI